ncbi:hypothetical protein EGT74_13205 [Chitinophaga lutea]|uniref:Uncharacterized protein n=1 Tax=Chitinophaga lutea TaxID=2488634 RepID=A0A3N4PII2_9BACT|nr:hypothetical protein [Chitinophaga lutea]RPE08026.1 hypothetical protein EGT74_13205 [Chitinophaga lutea]
MTADQFVLETIEKIRIADTNDTVKAIVTAARQSSGAEDITGSLLAALEEVSPLTCTSDQWDRLRFAKMMLYKPGVAQPA